MNVSAYYDILLVSNSSILHHCKHITEHKEISPTLEKFIVLTWLYLIHLSLPKLIRQHYSTELWSCTLSSIKPEISQALNSLLEEISTFDDARALHITTLWLSWPTYTIMNSSSFINKVKLPTVAEGDPSAPFSIATTLRCRKDATPLPWIAPLYPWSLLNNAEC